MLYQALSEQSSQDMTQSQFNQFINKLQEHREKVQTQEDQQYQVENELQPLIYNTLMLQYDIFLYEEELKYYKLILTEKQSQIKKLKEYQSKKNSKLNLTFDNIKKIDKRIKQVNEGYKIMNQKRHECEKSEITHRNQRLACQDKKNKLYQKYLDLEDKHNNLLIEIENYETYEAQHKQLQAQNEELREQIEKIEIRKRALEGDTPNNRKEELKNEVKKLYEKIKTAEKEEQRICKDYENRKKKMKILQNQQNSIGQRSLQMNSLYSRLTALKDECKQRKWTKQERQRQYHELLAQESQLKRQLSHYQQFQKRRHQEQKSNFVHNFRIIDSEADQQLVKGSKQLKSSSKHQSSVDSHQQFDELIGRFQQIKSKSKHLN